MHSDINRGCGAITLEPLGV